MIAVQVLAGIGTLLWLVYFHHSKSHWQIVYEVNTQQNPKGATRKKHMQNLRGDVGLSIAIVLMITSPLCYAMGGLAAGASGSFSDMNPDCGEFCMCVCVCVFFVSLVSFFCLCVCLSVCLFVFCACFYFVLFFFSFFFFAFFLQSNAS